MFRLADAFTLPPILFSVPKALVFSLQIKPTLAKSN
jgi:hypothetical protein